MEDENAELGLLAAKLLTGKLNILLELLDSVLESGAGVVNLVDDKDALSDEVAHLAQRAQVKPLGASDFGTGLLDLLVVTGGKALVERETNSLDGDVGATGLLEERPENSGGNIATTADGDHELGLHGLEKLGGCLLAELVYL